MTQKQLFAEFCQSLYSEHMYTDAQLSQFVAWGALDSSDYQTITGKAYEQAGGANA